MEDFFILSRSIIQNQTYEKFRLTRFVNHKKAINKLRYTSSSFDMAREDSPNYLKNLSKFKSAHKSISRIFDNQRLENQSLYRRLL